MIDFIEKEKKFVTTVKARDGSHKVSYECLHKFSFLKKLKLDKNFLPTFYEDLASFLQVLEAFLK